jgi:hypothetical protein
LAKKEIGLQLVGAGEKVSLFVGGKIGGAEAILGPAKVVTRRRVIANAQMENSDVE